MKIFINRLTYQKIQYWVHKTDKEISGLGIVEIIEGNAHIQDVLLLDQENSCSETEIKAEAIGKAMYEFHKANKKGDIKFWWHSHADMDVFWSQTDYECMDNLTENGWFIHTVFNKKGESKTAFTDGSINKLNTSGLNVEYEIFKDNLDLIIVDDIPNEQYKDWEKQFNEKVTEKKYIVEDLPETYLNDIEDLRWSDWDEVKEYKRKKKEMVCDSCYTRFTGDYYDYECPECKSNLTRTIGKKQENLEKMYYFCNTCYHQFEGNIYTTECEACSCEYIDEITDELKRAIGYEK